MGKDRELLAGVKKKKKRKEKNKGTRRQRTREKNEEFTDGCCI
jgi:hypothetical protein